MQITLLLVLELIGTVAFSISGAMVALKKRMDIFGIMVLGIITAVGGGVIRDVILGRQPPSTFTNPVYCVTAILAAGFILLPPVQRFITRSRVLFDKLMIVADAIGLGVFTTVGVRITIDAGFGNSILLMLFEAVITGCGGGVLRDTLACDMPAILVKYFYACASLCGALVCIVLWGLGEVPSMVAGTVVVIVLRLLAVKYRWNLPKPHPKFME